jgi:hypothetical protein
VSTKRYIVILDDSNLEKTVYLGELERGFRQGVYKRENAIRFTRIGAYRVAAQYPTACMGRGARVVEAH